MKKVLIASVGGSHEPIVSAIIQAQPDFVYFLCSTGKAGSDATVEKTIVPSVPRAEGTYAIERVQSPDELKDVLAACARIESDLAQRFAGEELEVRANYTGGTKTMSAGLVTLAQRRGWVAEVTERPARPWAGPVSKIVLEAVTVFEEAEIACSQGINVIIGENGTGKTHLLKCAYAMLRAAEEAERALPVPSWGDKLERVFRGRFRSSFAANGAGARVSVECERGRFERDEVAGAPAKWSLPAALSAKALFLPSREILSMGVPFLAAYDNRESTFDETYYDACKELCQAALREPRPELSAVLATLEGILGGPVRFEGNAFVVETQQGAIVAPMLAEGHRKLAALAYLIKNGALTSETILFWDEPEANLNAKLVSVVARVIRQLASAGIQIILATHDYLLARELSMAAEYGTPPVVDTLFFALHRGAVGGAVEVESSERWSHLDHNPIVEAYAAHHDREQELFMEEPPEDEP